MNDEIKFRFEAQKNVDKSLVMVVCYEGNQQAGTLIFTPEGWEQFQEQVKRTKVRCEV